MAPTVAKDTNRSQYPKSNTSGFRGAAVGVEEFRNLNTPITTKDISASVHSSQASQEAARALGPPNPRPCRLAPVVTTPPYRMIVSSTLAQRLWPCDLGASRCLWGCSART